MKKDRQTLIHGALEVLRSIAPEIQTGDINLALPLRRQVDLDSMDWLNFLVGLHERFGVTIAESDYSKLICLNDVVDYVSARLSD
jgi:acyl carrier protein